MRFPASFPPRFGVFLALMAATAAVYGQVYHHAFVNLDDRGYITENAKVLRGFDLRNVAWAFSATEMANWHPLTWLSHMLDVELFGVSAGWHHLVNVAFHGANGVLLFLLLSRLTGALGRSAFVAGLFLVHPLHVESVAWISERKDVLSGLFFLLTLWAYSGYVERRTRGRYFAVILWFALGLLSKPMVVTLPFALLLLDRWPLDRTDSWRDLLREKLPLFALSGVSCAVTLWVQWTGGAVSSFDAMSPGLRLANAVVSYAAYLGKTVWPVRLACFYPHPGDGLGWGKPAVCAVFLLAATGVSVRQRKRRPYLLWGWLWYLGMLVPVIGLVQVGGQGMADRYTYLPLIGPFVAAVWGVAEAAGEDRRRKAALAAAGISVLALLSLVSWRQVGIWRDTRTLHTHAIAVTRGNWVSERDLGTVSMEEGLFEEAVLHYKEALRIQPGDPKALGNLGVVLARLGKFGEAEALLADALRRYPDSHSANNNMGILLAAQGRLDDAIERFGEALRLRPEYPDALYNLGLALAQQGKESEAIPRFLETLRLAPGHVEAHVNLGVAYAGKGYFPEAIDHFEEAVRLDPRNGEAQYNLGFALARQGRLDESLPHLREAARLKPGNRAAAEQLEAVLSALGGR